MEGVQNQGMAPPGVPAFMQHYVKLRPHITKFLKSVQADYELTVYTAGTRQYAEEITVVLCRHMVGSRYDIDDLERLRYDLHMARIEYRKFQSLNQVTEKVDEEWKKSQEEENLEVCASDEPPVKKRKKVVSFGAPVSDSNDAEGDKGNASANLSGKSDHMTKDKLQILEKELQSAEELEKQAWELRQKLFGSRVVSRTDVGDLGRDVKSLKRIFPCGGTMAAVIDDREDVWANASDNSVHTIKGEPPDNLILVRPYHWQPFSGFADVNNAAGDDLSGGQSGNGDGEDPSVEKDVQLVWISRILKGLHRRFYRQDMDNRKSVPELLAEMRYQVLYGATLVLSGLVPLNMKALGADQARPPIVRYAQSLGARVGTFLCDRGMFLHHVLC
jgi:RNA polymerase II subunit A-like phosphatase